MGIHCSDPCSNQVLSLHQWLMILQPRSQWRQPWNALPEHVVKSHSLLLTNHLLLPTRLQTRLTKDAFSSEKTIMVVEAKRACWFCTESLSLLGLGTLFSCQLCLFHISCDSLRPTVWSTALFPEDCLHELWSFYLVLPSDIYLLTLDFCWLIGLSLITAQTLAFLVVALFSYIPSVCCHIQHEYYISLDFYISKLNIYCFGASFF